MKGEHKALAPSPTILVLEVLYKRRWLTLRNNRQKAGQLFKDKVATLPPELQQAKGFLKGSTVPVVRP